MPDAALPPQPKWIRRPDSAEVYSNFHFANFSISDVRIRFGQLIPVDSEEGQTIERVAEERAAVTMTWVQAKALLATLSEIVERYEKANGVIDLPNIKLP